MYTYYLKVVVTLAVIVGSFGFGIPFLVSAPSTVMVLSGFALLAATPLVIHWIWSDEIGKFTKAAEEAIFDEKKDDTETKNS